MIVLRKWFAVGALIFLAGCQSDQESPESEAVVQQEGTESVLKEMDVPWSINEHSGTFYLSERKGKIVKWDSTAGKKDVQDVSFEKKYTLKGKADFSGCSLPRTSNKADKPMRIIHIRMAEALRTGLLSLRSEMGDGKRCVSCSKTFPVPAFTMEAG